MANDMVICLSNGKSKELLSDNGYGQRVYSLGDSKHKEFTIWYMVKKRLQSSVSTPGGFTLWERIKKSFQCMLR